MSDVNPASFAKAITFPDGVGNGRKHVDGAPLKRVVSYSRVWWKFKMRDDEDDEDV